MKPALASNALLVACLTLGLSLGCAKKATLEQCRPACEHTAKLVAAPVYKQLELALHELDEKVERTEDESAASTAALKKQMATPDTTWDEKAMRKRPAKAQAALRERHAWEQNQLKVQRELALKSAAEAIVSAKKELADKEAQRDVEVKKAGDDARAACLEKCQRSSIDHAACLQRTQAVEDIEICER